MVWPGPCLQANPVQSTLTLITRTLTLTRTLRHNPCNPQHYPVTGRCHSDGCGKPCPADSNMVDPDTAKLLVTNYGRPLAGAEAVPGNPNVFQRRYELATVELDCNNFSGRFQLK